MQEQGTSWRSCRGTGTPISAPSLALAIAAMLLAASCEVGPNYKLPTTTMPAAWGEIAGGVNSQAAQMTRWWEGFDDPVLNQLVQQAVEGNLNLQQAIARIRQARGERGVAVAALLPTANASAQYQRTNLGVGGGAGFGGVGGHDLYQVGLDASWEIDVFGGRRRGIEAAEANIAAAVADRNNVLVTLLAEVALNYLQLRGYQREIAVTLENVRAQRDALALTQARFEAGAANQLDVVQAQAQLSGTQAQVPPLQTLERQAIHSLGVLLGKEPMALSDMLSPAKPIPPPPPEVPAGLPAELLRRRPDISQAERQLAAATAEIGVAEADLYPRFFLGGSITRQGLSLGSLGGTAGQLWGLGPSVSWPFFQGGATLSNIEIQRALQTQAALTYRQTVLTALQEVEDALVAYANEHTHNQDLAAAVTASQRSADLSRFLYVQGTADFLTVLIAQQALFRAQAALVQSDSALSTDVVALYKALGGGWEGLDSPVPASRPASER